MSAFFIYGFSDQKMADDFEVTSLQMKMNFTDNSGMMKQDWMIL